MTKALPETLKQTEVHGILEPGTLTGYRFDAKVGEGEALLLRSAYYWWHGTPVAGANEIKLGLWRKSDKNPAGAISIYNAGDHEDMIWSTHHVEFFVTESMVAGRSEHVIFPKPIILIRPPRLLLNFTGMTANVWGVRLFYEMITVSNKDMQRLMLNDRS